MNDQLVSIIMPSYNSAQTIAASIESVMAQSYRHWELLISDDGSNDDTVAVIQKYADNEPRIKLEKLTENGGAGKARNSAIKRAQGRYIAFLDADDLWYPNKLEKQLAFMQNETVALCYSAYDRFDSNGKRESFYPPETTDYNELLKSNVIGCLTAVYDRALCGTRYMPAIRKRQDMALWLNILKDEHRAKAILEPLANYRLDGGISHNKLRVLSYQWQLYRDVEKLSLPRTILTFMHYVRLGLKKHS
ncbi:glycosyltransferase involved in cell wall biosynthesis [Idiomarina aquatica]|uniref:Glycosyltransferase involved in cell wall biosynthesis n=1 Tax=Idiomarina aquatica TaxID=1327752 RepID=A0A4R6PPF8_9GAMM|nr:glycosyltransferase family 2 protein [Idiomarina aquatica]TDP40245.1 glycosyltransferase involved in cell wall biosynthesis [Idiomarina aquatica]